MTIYSILARLWINKWAGSEWPSSVLAVWKNRWMFEGYMWYKRIYRFLTHLHQKCFFLQISTTYRISLLLLSLFPPIWGHLQEIQYLQFLLVSEGQRRPLDGSLVSKTFWKNHTEILYIDKTITEWHFFINNMSQRQLVKISIFFEI